MGGFLFCAVMRIYERNMPGVSFPLFAATRNVDGDYSRDYARYDSGEKVGEVKVRTLETVRDRKHEYAQQHIQQTCYRALYRSAACALKTDAHADEHCDCFYDIVSYREGGAVKRRPAHDESESEHEHQRYKQSNEGGAQNVGYVFFQQSGVFHGKILCCPPPRYVDPLFLEIKKLKVNL